MQELFEALPPFALYNVSDLISPDRAVFPKETFLQEYATSIQALKKKQVYDMPTTLFSCAISQTPHAFYAIEVRGKIILKRIKPVIQVLLHHFTYSSKDHQFRVATCHQESVQWGIQFSYPHLYSNSKIGEVVKVMRDPNGSNTQLFRSLTQWIRIHSRPTSFLIKGRKIKTAIRLGNQCMAWIKNHPQLSERGLMVT